MQINCPICGARDGREFSYKGAASLLDRPEPGSGADAFHAYLHLRDNPAGEHSELWWHAHGCQAWLCVVRNVQTHEILDVALASQTRRGAETGATS